jgi:hypothetical protein
MNNQTNTCNDIYCNGKMVDWAMSSTFSKETEKAVLVRVYFTQEKSACYNREVWIPKSLLVIDRPNLAAHLPAWFVSKNIEPICR